MTDAELLRKARGGDAEAWRVLYARHLDSVWRQAYALVGDLHVAEDITSETMFALLKSLSQPEREGAPLTAWLRTVVRRKAADHHRQAFRQQEKLPHAPSSDAVERLAAPQSVPAAEIKETQTHVWQALDALDDRHRTVLEWKYFDGLSVHDMSSRLGATEKAVETLLYRARNEFRRLFAEQQSLRKANSARLSAAKPDAPHESS